MLKKVNIESIDFKDIHHPIFGAPISGVDVSLDVYFPKKPDETYYWVRVCDLLKVNYQEIEKVVAVDGVHFDAVVPAMYIVLKMPKEYIYIKTESDGEYFPELVEDINHNYAYLSTFKTLSEVLEHLKMDKTFYDCLKEQHDYEEKENYYKCPISGLAILNLLIEKETLEQSVETQKNTNKILKV